MSSRLPPSGSLPRPNKGKIRLAARVCSEDLRPGGLSFHVPSGQIFLPHSSKTLSKHTFDTVFAPDCAQSEISTSLLPDLLNGLVAGIDGAFISFGGLAKRKDAILYSPMCDQLGLFQSAVNILFPLLDNSAEHLKQCATVRISALHFSQRTNAITDLLSQFNTDPRRWPVRVVEDPVEGARVENASEIRVDSVDQAMFYLNTVIDHRLIEEEESHRCSHLFFTISITRIDRKTSLHLVDLGMGERNSQRGALSMPAIGNILIAICQGQKSLPHRDSCLGALLRVTVGRSRLSTFLCSFTDRVDDNENILQLASKLSKARRNPRRTRVMGDSTSVSSTERKRRSDLESSSEQSAPETVIFMGPAASIRRPSDPFRHNLTRGIPLDGPLRPLQLNLNGSPSHHAKSSPSRSSNTQHSSPLRTPSGSVAPLLKGFTPFFSPYSKTYDELCSPPGTSRGMIDGDDDPREEPIEERLVTGENKKHTRESAEAEKRAAIHEWIEEALALGRGNIEEPEDTKEFIEREREMRVGRALEDIQEMDEESMKESLRSSVQSATIVNARHPLSILSLEAVNQVDSPEGFKELEVDDALEKAMAASISSIISHDLLLKVKHELEDTHTLSTEPSEMDVYRRASALEEYGTERLRELKELEKKKKKKYPLNCCQSLLSSDASQLEERKVAEEEDKERREELKRRRDELKEEEEELRRKREEIKKQLETPLFRHIAQHISSLTMKAAGFKPKPVPCLPSTSDSLPTTPTIPSRRLHAFPDRTPSFSNTSSPAHKASRSSLPVRRQERRNGSRSRVSKEREEKKEDIQPSTSFEAASNVSSRSPYFTVTPAMRPASRAESSGRGSDDNGSSVIGNGGTRKKKRESYSASSGYESATGDYRHYTGKQTDARIDRLRFIPDKRCGFALREADRLREKQRDLQQELLEAKERIGERVDEWSGGLEGKSALSHVTLLDTLMQENRILEKRVVACQNHAMIVTTLV